MGYFYTFVTVLHDTNPNENIYTLMGIDTP